MPVSLNPYGILFNPISILSTLEDLHANRKTDPNELIQHEGRWIDLRCHGSFSASTADELIRMIDTATLQGHTSLQKARYVIITWGTAWVYEHRTSGRVVANCHKQPATHFTRELLTVDEIVAQWRGIVQQIEKQLPQCRLLFTVSPIRHLSDGAHGNQISKATLLLAADTLCRRYPETYSYFPAYEIVMDELRDYRFYAEDLTHPAAAAVAYIRERFAEAYFTSETARLATACEKIATGLRHRPLKGCGSPAYRDFAASLLRQMDELAAGCDAIDYSAERKEIEQLLQHNCNEL